VVRLKELGASHVLNYKTTANWGEIARSLTPDSRGVDIVVDVGGPSTVGQSLKAVRTDGVVSLAGLLGAGTEANVPSIMDALSHLCITRGVLLGTRVQFREMNQFIDEKGIRPVVDERVFTFKEVKGAYDYMEAQRHFSKIAIDIE
jgi:NADPH:quinone reductase-like Zn-dependent oxidoreductase